MALHSGVRSELAWALNVLALASCSGATPLELRHHPDLLPLLLKVAQQVIAAMLTLMCTWYFALIVMRTRCLCLAVHLKSGVHQASASCRQVMKDDLEDARPGYIRAADPDGDAQEQPFVGPPCKRSRLAVDAPQVHCFALHVVTPKGGSPLMVSGWMCIITCIPEHLQGEDWERDEAIIAPFDDPEQRRGQDDATQVSTVRCMSCRTLKLMLHVN